MSVKSCCITVGASCKTNPQYIEVMVLEDYVVVNSHDVWTIIGVVN